MNEIAILDLITFIAALAGIIIAVFRWKHIAAWEIKWLVISIMILTLLYSSMLFIEWYGGIMTFESYEDMIGALIPMMWGFFFYAVIQHASKADLRTSENRLNMALKGAGVGLWDWDIGTDLINCNERMVEIFGYSMDELEPFSMKTLRGYLHKKDRKTSEDLLEQHFKNEIKSYECEIRIKHKNGQWIWVMERGMVVERNHKGNPIRMIGTHIDITGRKKFFEEMKHQRDENLALYKKYMAKNKEFSKSIKKISKINRELIKAKEMAEESDRLKLAFLSNVSHEIRTPMNGIIGFSTMLKKQNLSDEKRMAYTDIIIESSNQLLAIVNDILDISRIETGELEISEEGVNVGELMNELNVFFKPQAESKGISLRLKINRDDTQTFVKTDKVRLKQILSNLLQNAVKFTDKGYIEFGHGRTDRWLQFYVKDSGIGIDEKYHEEIFKPFRQVELEITRVPGGAGLGLSISRRLVEALGGKMWMESQPGAGSTFYFNIPGIFSFRSRNEISLIKEEFTFPAERTVILVAEDDDVNFRYLHETLNHDTIRIIRARNGLEAVEYCKADREIHIVFMDIKMPVLNGYDATRQIKRFRPEVPVIAVTAFTKDDDRAFALNAGCDDYLSKPLRKDELLTLINKYRHYEP
ncbi:MAG: response regulator [Bacteroidales bacterium]|nr:response regulator [Bacteroidales bacterium]